MVQWVHEVATESQISKPVSWSACKKKWIRSATDLCPCGKIQIMSHIVNLCPLTKLCRGFFRLHWRRLCSFMVDQLWFMMQSITLNGKHSVSIKLTAHLNIFVIVFRSTPPSRPNNTRGGLKCLSVHKKFFSDFNDRVRWLMNDGMPYDPIQGQGQGHECLKATQEESPVSPARDYW